MEPSKPSKYINYESIRNINVPRVFSISNPFSYYHQCKALSNSWNDLLEYFREVTENHTHKISRSHIKKILGSEQIFESNYIFKDINEIVKTLMQKKANSDSFNFDDDPVPSLLIGNKYKVEVDISSCFPSIYTHSIPWAIIGKKESKKERDSKKAQSTGWYNDIDKLTRNLKDGETHGILIGCHSSYIISEIVLAKIDEKMYENGYKYIRNIDDYNCYVKDQRDADNFILDLSKILKNYNLTLNHKKTKVRKLPLPSTKSWVIELNSFKFEDVDGEYSLLIVKKYLDIVIKLMTENDENSSIINYAIKTLSSKQLDVKAKNYFIKTIHHLILLYPYLIHLLDNFIFKSFKIEKDYIENISKDIFELGVSQNISEPICFAIFFSLKYDFKLDDCLYDKSIKIDNSLILLLAYLHDKKYLNSTNNFKKSSLGKKYRDLAKSMLNDIDENWIFVYEVLPACELVDDWKKIKESNVSFIKECFL